jgi:hypothetical protein
MSCRRRALRHAIPLRPISQVGCQERAAGAPRRTTKFVVICRVVIRNLISMIFLPACLTLHRVASGRHLCRPGHGMPLKNSWWNGRGDVEDLVSARTRGFKSHSDTNLLNTRSAENHDPVRPAGGALRFPAARRATRAGACQRCPGARTSLSASTSTRRRSSRSAMVRRSARPTQTPADSPLTRLVGIPPGRTHRRWVSFCQQHRVLAPGPPPNPV